MKRKIFANSLIAIILLLTINSCEPVRPPRPNDNSLKDDSPNYTVSTFAGNGSNGMDPDTGGLALLFSPMKIAFDVQGNLYVADMYNDKIRKITPSGAMTTLAGSTIGYADGTGNAAQFNRPSVLCLDTQGNLYVAEAGNLRIRKITPGGIVTTIAGNGVAGVVNGTGVAAQIDIPTGIGVDAQGNIYFTQINFHGVRKVSPAGLVSTFVGSLTPGFVEGTGGLARFNEAGSLVLDAQENIYVSDFKNARIRKVTLNAVVTTVVQRANESEMGIIAIDGNENFYITQGDFSTSLVVKVTPAGTITKIAGGDRGYADGIGNTAKFNYISGIAVNANGDVYISDLNDMIRKIKRN